MKPATLTLTATCIAGMLIVIAAQWHINSKLRTEKHELLEVRNQIEQVEADLAKSKQVLEQRANELQGLRAELTAAQRALQEAQQHTVSASNKTISGTGLNSNPNKITPSPPEFVPGSSLPNDRATHLRPGVQTNLPVTQVDHDLVAYLSPGRVDKVRFWSSITRESVLSGPDWRPTEPLPLNHEDGEKIARKELGKFVEDEQFWEIKEINLHRLGGHNSTKWHYSFVFSPPGRWDRFAVHVNMAGQPGTTTLRAEEP